MYLQDFCKKTFIHIYTHGCIFSTMRRSRGLSRPTPLQNSTFFKLYQKYASDRPSQPQIIGKFSGSAHEYIYTFCISLDLFTTALKLSRLSEY